MNPRLMPRINIIDTLVGNGHPSDVDLVLVDGQIVLGAESHDCERGRGTSCGRAGSAGDSLEGVSPTSVLKSSATVGQCKNIF